MKKRHALFAKRNPIHVKKLACEEPVFGGDTEASVDSTIQAFHEKDETSIALESSKIFRAATISTNLQLNTHAVRLWIMGFNQDRGQGLESRPVSGRPPSMTDRRTP